MKNKISLKERALKYLRNEQGFINSGELERLAIENGYKGSTLSRELRIMCAEEKIIREERKNETTGRSSVWYKATPPKVIKYYVGAEQVSTKTMWP